MVGGMLGAVKGRYGGVWQGMHTVEGRGNGWVKLKRSKNDKKAY